MKITLSILLTLSLVIGPAAIPIVHAQTNSVGNLASSVIGGAASCFSGYIAGIASSAVTGFLSGAGSAGTSLIAGTGAPVYDASNHAGRVGASLERVTLIETEANLLVKECVIDPLVAGIAQLIREQVLQRIFRYVGGTDSPAFVQRLISRLQNLGRRVADEQLRILIVYVNESWRRDFERELSRELFTPPEQQFVFDAPACTNINGVIDHGETFDSGNYIGGGGSACLYDRIRKYKANINVTAYSALRNSIADASFDAQEIARDEFIAGGGFKANQECIEVPIANANGTIETGEAEDTGGEIPGTITPGQAANSGNTVEYCYNVTPGSTIAHVANTAVTNPLDQLNLADEIGEIVRLLVIDIINHAIGAGLSEINNAVGGQASYTSQLGNANEIGGGTLVEAGIVTSTGETGDAINNLESATAQSLLSRRIEVESFISTERQSLSILAQALQTIDGVSGTEDLRITIENTISVTELNVSLAEEVLIEIQALELQFSQTQNLNEIGSLLFKVNQITSIRGINQEVAELQKIQAEALLERARIAAGIILPTLDDGTTGGGGTGSIDGGGGSFVGVPTAPTPGNGSGNATVLWTIPMGQDFVSIANSTWWDARTANLRFPDSKTVRVQYDPSNQNTRGGVHGFFRIPPEHTENGQRVCLSYDIKLQDGFPHAAPKDNSCKLPGLAGGEIQFAGGGRLTSDKRAFSTRLGVSSWYTRQHVVNPYFYLRWDKQPATNGIVPSFGIYGYGQDITLSTVDAMSNKYSNVTQCVTLNTNDQPNGSIQVWIDGSLRQNNQDVYITDGSFDIDYVFMSHFCNQPVPSGTYTDFTNMYILEPDDLFQTNGSPIQNIDV